MFHIIYIRLGKKKNLRGVCDSLLQCSPYLFYWGWGIVQRITSIWFVMTLVLERRDGLKQKVWHSHSLL